LILVSLVIALVCLNTRALDLDEAGESDIYKINLLEAMCMARKAWKSVDKTTLKNCWKHAAVQLE